MSTSKEIFWTHFQGTGVDNEIFSILYDSAIAEIEKNDTIYLRIKKFDQLIESQLLKLNERDLELATIFLLGYLKGHLPIKKIEEISEALRKAIENNL